MQNKNPTLWVLITTMNSGIDRVKSNLISKLSDADEIIVSHQITDSDIYPEKESLGDNVSYHYMYNTWLSKNRNCALKASYSDICHICDDDIEILPWYVDIIKEAYKNNDSDVITFQAINEVWELHFNASEWKHNSVSILRIWSWGVTFSRNAVLEKNILFDENFWLWAKYPVGEENIFLHDCHRLGLKTQHINYPIVMHPTESSWHNYRDELVISRIKLWKRMWGKFGWVAAVLYFTVFDYKHYKISYSPYSFFVLSCRSLMNK